MAILDSIYNWLDKRRKENIRKAELQAEINKILLQGPHWHQWGIEEIRTKLSNPTSIYDVEQALKVLIKKTNRVKKQKRVFYIFD